MGTDERTSEQGFENGWCHSDWSGTGPARNANFNILGKRKV